MPPKSFKTKTKVIFVFAEEDVTRRSAENMTQRTGFSWFHENQYHLQAKRDYDKIQQEDVLNYKSQIEEWSAQKNILILPYEQIWDELTKIEDFLGFSIQLPKKRARVSLNQPV